MTTDIYLTNSKRPKKNQNHSKHIVLILHDALESSVRTCYHQPKINQAKYYRQIKRRRQRHLSTVHTYDVIMSVDQNTVPYCDKTDYGKPMYKVMRSSNTATDCTF